MNLDILEIQENTSLTTVDIDTTEFNKITEIIKLAFTKLSINIEGMQIYYQRNKDATSILAIQLETGDQKDMNNYMINGSQAWRHDHDISCDVYMHANKKVSQKAMKLSNLISKPIVDFFEEFEKELLKTNNFDIYLSITIPLSKPKEDNCINRLIRRIRKNKI